MKRTAVHIVLPTRGNRHEIRMPLSIDHAGWPKFFNQGDRSDSVAAAPRRDDRGNSTTDVDDFTNPVHTHFCGENSCWRESLADYAFNSLRSASLKTRATPPLDLPALKSPVLLRRV